MPSESFCIYQQENLVIGHKMIFGAKKVSPVVQSSVYRQPTSRCLSSAKRTYLWGVAVCAHTNSPAQQSVTWHHVAYACAQQYRRASAGRCRLQIWNRLSLETARSLPKTIKKKAWRILPPNLQLMLECFWGKREFLTLFARGLRVSGTNKNVYVCVYVVPE